MNKIIEITTLEEMCDLMCGYIEEDDDYCDDYDLEETRERRSKIIDND